uniref:Sec-independent protein translocase protein TatC n=1 Tax=Candidatus Kentrum sp. FM TaxID=2126340 RepID=A0A450WPK1_9GAMM|nr:MAG: sec-independent protein translocase protein TatC [Candidatus Kentron sp. FM]VFJ71555.1 MAG: sec-independent protein translocase protein TatC [Candidatus Kentron sp. FM]VFK18919.1 MAG: sec-independent protein translocase protein TatC [Candidatus Kentron sp. FM]
MTFAYSSKNKIFDFPMFKKKPRIPRSTQGEMPFVSHLIELRDRLLRALVAILVVLLGLVPFANDLYEWLSAPLLRYLPEGTSMIATEVASPFFAPFKLAIVTAVFIAMPVIIYQLWAFVAPGLYRNEKKLVYPLMVTSTILFYLGALFAYFAVFPLVFGFFTSVAPEGVEVATDISKYLDFVLKLFFAFGLAFEVPVATILLVAGGFTTPEDLASKRPYVIVSAFVIGMLLTPPDVISQTLLALPMWVLFELGLVFSRIYLSGKGAGKDKASGEEPEGSSEGNPPKEDYRYDPITEEEE